MDQEIPEPPDLLGQMIKSRERCEVLQHKIHTVNNLFLPVNDRRLEAKAFQDIQISPAILRQLDREMETFTDYLDQLKDFLKVCYFCGKLFTSEMANTGCFVNRSKNLPFNCSLRPLIRQSVRFTPILRKTSRRAR